MSKERGVYLARLSTLAFGNMEVAHCAFKHTIVLFHCLTMFGTTFTKYGITCMRSEGFRNRFAIIAYGNYMAI